MSKLGQVVESVENYNKFVLDQVKRARRDDKFGRELLGRWNDIKAKIPVYAHANGTAIATACSAGNRRAGGNRALFLWRRIARRISVFERGLSRNVSRAGPRNRKL